MITLSTLEEVEGKKGVYYGLPVGESIVYLGILDGKVDEVTGLISKEGQILVEKDEATKKGNTTKFYKKYNMAVQSSEIYYDQQVKQVKQSVVNKILSEYAVIEVVLPSLAHQVIGYQLNEKLFDVGEESLMIQSIEQAHVSSTSSIKDMIAQSEFIIKPFKYTINLISRMSAPSENIIQQILIPLEKEKSFRFIGKISSTKYMEYLLKNAIQHLMNHGQLKQPPEFLNNLITQPPTKIWNPHTYLPTPALFLHQRFMFKGNYQFYHYNDQFFNDNGWGCAYRAFQSLLSWFNLGGYTSVPIPTIQQIQKSLFQIDRTRNLINTKEWIGANQVGWLVQKYTTFESKIIFLQDGQNVMEKVDVFRHHFETMGTPIMYGGGQYAYTILGINYSWKLNECQFLILDPHYTLEDKPKSIVEKEGVSWKDKSKLFKKGVYYNFCLPQVKKREKENKWKNQKKMVMD